MAFAPITTQLAGQLPLITMAGITVKYSEAMLGKGPLSTGRRRSTRSRSRRRSRGGYRSPQRNAFGGISPI